MSFTLRNGKVYDDDGNLIKTRVDADGITVDDDNNVIPIRALAFKSFADCAREQPKEWLIKGVAALNENSSWYGPPGAFKSTLALDIGIHIAGGKDWHGHPANYDSEHRGVIIFDLERGGLTRRRLEAYRQNRDLPDDLPLAVVDEIINLMDPACVDQISDTIYEFEGVHHCETGLVIFDTWSKCLGGQNEDSSAVQNQAALHLSKIRRRYHSSFHSLSIGHTGKNIAAGERGSNARQGHVDIEVLVNKGKAVVTKANDMPLQVVLANFEAEEVTAIRPEIVFPRRPDQGGDLIYPAEPWTVSILAPYNADQSGATIAREARAAISEPTGKNGEALEALKRAIAARGQDGAVLIDHWKAELSKADLLPGKNPRVPFARIRTALSQHIIEEGNSLRLQSNPSSVTFTTPLKGGCR